MRRNACLIVCFAVLLGFVASGPAGAVLIVLEAGYGEVQRLVYDDVTGLTWLRHLDTFHNKNYQDQKDLISALELDQNGTNYSTWRMANETEATTLWAYGASLWTGSCFEPSHVDIGSWYTMHHYKGRIDEAHPQYSSWHKFCGWSYREGEDPDHYLPGDTAYISDSSISFEYGAWVVTGTVITSPIPEPTTGALLGLCLLGWAAIMARRKRSQQ